MNSPLLILARLLSEVIVASGEPFSAIGPDYLVAACRAIVAAKLGDTVQVPKELMP